VCSKPQNCHMAMPKIPQCKTKDVVCNAYRTYFIWACFGDSLSVTKVGNQQKIHYSKQRLWCMMSTQDRYNSITTFVIQFKYYWLVPTELKQGAGWTTLATGCSNKLQGTMALLSAKLPPCQPVVHLLPIHCFWLTIAKVVDGPLWMAIIPLFVNVQWCFFALYIWFASWYVCCHGTVASGNPAWLKPT